MQKTYMPTWEEAKNSRTWVLVDAENKTLGRLATDIAIKLRGKDRPDFTKHVDNGSFVVVINAEKIRLTGNKIKDKVYYHHTGYLGGIKGITAEEQLTKHPTKLIEDAVAGMLPSNKLSRHLMTKLKIYAGSKHPHSAQFTKSEE
jgi:large subunit ribosomal protein L13